MASVNDMSAGVAAGPTIAVAVPDPKLRLPLLEALRKLAAPVIEENCDTVRLEELLAAI